MLPPTEVTFYADLLARELADSLTPEQAENLRSIQQGANRMIALVDQILDLSRLDAGQMELEVIPLNLAQIVEQVRLDAAPQAAS